MFLKIIALFFLLIFLIKAFNPRIFPLIGRAIQYVFRLLGSYLKIIFESFFYSIYLLFTNTIYVVGIVLLASLIIGIYKTYMQTPNVYDIQTFYQTFKTVILDIYVQTFFIGTYLVGFIKYLMVRTRLKDNMGHYFSYYFNKRFTNKNR